MGVWAWEFTRGCRVWVPHDQEEISMRFYASDSDGICHDNDKNLPEERAA